MPNEKIWFVTGASRGFGRLWTEAALKRGDRVAATARDVSALDDLVGRYGNSVLPLRVDVTDHDAVVAAVNHAHQHFGRLDIVLSNAGYGVSGAVEEVSLDEARANLDTNVLGTLSVAKAALPLLREQKSGHIIAVSSVAGLATFPLGGIYHASKFAVEGLIGALAKEVAGFGIRVTLIEPGPFATDFMSETSMTRAAPIAAYDPMREQLAAVFTPEMFGDPATTIDAVFKIVDAPEPPLHIIFGPLLPLVRQGHQARLQILEEWEAVGNPPTPAG
ncbi:SDR family NAD(P)-dependent oxidoreductase [Sphingomonas sp.]|uniref:SDR family NAD(P)-dependent oxidoreductase n=1 Tax=Sphingomonas sp. TaxID=28214 RepID=UPI003D6CEACD